MYLPCIEKQVELGLFLNVKQAKSFWLLQTTDQYRKWYTVKANKSFDELYI